MSRATAIPNVAVSDFQADGVSSSDASVIANLLRGELVKSGMFNVVEKKNMDKVLAEQAFQQTGCTTQECA
ncbi:MAG: CsgG/HfaB family protein, partial [bacterium]